MVLVAKHCVTCGSKKLVMIGRFKRYFNKTEEMSSHVIAE